MPSRPCPLIDNLPIEYKLCRPSGCSSLQLSGSRAIFQMKPKHYSDLAEEEKKLGLNNGFCLQSAERVLNSLSKSSSYQQKARHQDFPTLTTAQDETLILDHVIMEFFVRIRQRICSIIYVADVLSKNIIRLSLSKKVLWTHFPEVMIKAISRGLASLSISRRGKSSIPD